MGPYGDAALLGLLQGITEFLPVSSSGHLALAGMLFGLEEAGLTLNVTLHAGTLIATALVLRARLKDAVVDGVKALGDPKRFRTTAGGQDALAVILATIPTVIIGFSLRDTVDGWTHSPLAVGLGFVVTTVLLLSTRWAPTGNVDFPSWKMALLIGLAQGMAVTPGISRSGSTIAVALWLGVARGRAFELSMLMSLPAVTGAVILELPHALENPSAFSPALFGAAIAFASGVLALLALRRIVTGGLFPWFALWVGPLAIATLMMARAWPG